MRIGRVNVDREHPMPTGTSMQTVEGPSGCPTRRAEAASMDTHPKDTAPVDSASVDMAPVDTAPADSAPVDSASVDTPQGHSPRGGSPRGHTSRTQPPWRQPPWRQPPWTHPLWTQSPCLPPDRDNGHHGSMLVEGYSESCSCLALRRVGAFPAGSTA